MLLAKIQHSLSNGYHYLFIYLLGGIFPPNKAQRDIAEMTLRSPVRQSFNLILCMTHLIFGLESKCSKNQNKPHPNTPEWQVGISDHRSRDHVSVAFKWIGNSLSKAHVDKGKFASAKTINVLFLGTSNRALKISFRNSRASEPLHVSLEHRTILWEGLQKLRIVRGLCAENANGRGLYI